MAEMRVHVDNPVSDPVNITGSISTTPTGTQDVNIVNPVSDPVHVTPVKDNNITGVYVFSADQISGVAAANNYLSLANPTGSGKLLYFGGAFISCVTAGGSTTTSPMRGYRATLISAGTLQPDSTVGKFISSSPDPVAEIRVGNPTATLGAALFNSPPPLSAGNGTTPVHQVPIPPNSGPFVLAEGEGIVLREEVGDTDLRWNLSVVWAEV